MDGEDRRPDEHEELIAARRRRRQELKRKRMLRQRVIYGVLLLVIILIFAAIIRGCGGKSGDKSPETGESAQSGVPGVTSARPELKPGEDAPVADRSVTLCAVGDIMMYDEQLKAAYDAASESYSFKSWFEYVGPDLAAADIAVANLETTLPGGPSYSGYPDFKSPESLAADLAEAGIDLLLTANTYSLQNGRAGLMSTIKHIREAGMGNVGTYYSQQERETDGGVVIREVNGLKLGFIGYTKGTNNISIPSGSEFAVNVLYNDYDSFFSDLNKDGILADLEAAKRLDLDLLVALVHWGSEYYTEHNEAQEEVAELLFSNGVDLILGSHPHTLQSMEKRTITYEGKEKEVFVAYSLGNFIAAQDKPNTNESLLLNIEIGWNSQRDECFISEVSYKPVYIYTPSSGSSGDYVLLDIYAAMSDYESGAESYVGETLYEALLTALNNIHKNAGSEFDPKA